ncbi:CHAT domain-containing protein [candidate division KSB1 bacterium]|nr:CHAT domain-containing protein [candidate division KSB1 bacterium]
MIHRYLVCCISVVILCTVTCSHLSDSTINEQIIPPARSLSGYHLADLYHQLTTHPNIDIMPALSPDGRWLAFASKRSGNMDIWVKPVNGGKAIQITQHKADDLYPEWCPKLKYLYFVSSREDAAGDIWKIEISRIDEDDIMLGDMSKVTDYLGIDESPKVSPDASMIAYTSDRGGSRNIWIYDIKKRTNFRLTRYGGMSPCWSPDSRNICFSSLRNDISERSKLYTISVPPNDDRASMSYRDQDEAFPITNGTTIDALPSWSPQGDKIVFTRYEIDTNEDGTINPQDMPTIFTIDIKTKISMQILPGDKYAYFPHWGSDQTIYYVSEKDGNFDIWSIAENGPIPKQENAFLQYQFAELFFPMETDFSTFGTTSENTNQSELYMRLLGFSRTFEFFPDDQTWSNYALLEIIKTYYALEKSQLAEIYKQILLEKDVIPKDIAGNLSLISLKADINKDHEKRQRLEYHLRHLYQESNEYFGDEELTIRFDMVIAEVYSHLGDVINAIDTYNTIKRQYPHQRNFAAMAQIRLSENYESIGTSDEVVNSYIEVVRNYPDQVKWVDHALEKLVADQSAVDHVQRIENYRELIDKFPEVKKLGARMTLEIARSFYQAGDLKNAETEITTLSQVFAGEEEELAEAELLLVEVHVKRDDELRAIHQLKSIAEKYSELKSGYYVIQAKQRLLDLYLSSARRLRNAGDYELAIMRYRGAIDIQFHNVEAHRGQVFIMSRVGQLDNSIYYYSQQHEQSPDDEIIQYILGLCYSYKATELSEESNDISRLDISMLKKSNTMIEDALSRNYQLIHAYLTLSYNYEISEHFDNYNLNRQKTLAERVFDTISTPIVSLWRSVTFQRPLSAERWYEKAIDALTTGISLNDEETDPQLESELALNLAQNYYNLEEFGFEKAYEFYHRKLKFDTTFTSLANKAEIYKRMGHCAVVVEDGERGPVYLKKAIQLFTKLENEQQVLINIKRLALLYQSAGNYEEAIDYYDQGIEIEEKYELWNEVQKSYRSIAYNYQLLNDEEEAIRYASLSAELLASKKVKVIEKEPNWIKLGILGIEFPVYNIGSLGSGESTAIEGFTTEEETALTYSIMADAYIKQRNYEKAIVYYRKKLSIYRAYKDKLAESIFLNNIGYLYYLKGDYSNAGRYFEESYIVAQSNHLIAGMAYNAINMGSIGVILMKNSKLEESNGKYEIYLHETLGYFNANTIGLERERVQLFLMLGNISYYSNQGNDAEPESQHLDEGIRNYQKTLSSLSKSFEFYTTAHQLAANKKYYYELILADMNLAHLYSMVHEFSHALDHLQEARINAIKHEYISQIWRIDHMIAGIIIKNVEEADLKRIGFNHSAAFYYLEAISILEENSARTTDAQLTPIYLQDMERLYKDAIRYYLKIDSDTAFLLAERMRSKKYLDIISTHKLELKKERHKNFIGLARDNNRRIAEIESQIRQELSLADPSPTELRRLQQQKQVYVEEYKELLREMNAEDPELESMVHVNPDLIETVRSILTPNTIVFSYSIIDDSVHIWSFDQFSSNYVCGTEFHLTDYFNKNLLLTKNNVDSLISNLDYDYVHEKLIQPLYPLIEDYSNIVIVPDEMLYLVPFHSLLYIKNKAIFRSKSVVLVPSISSYYFSYQKRRIKGNNVLLTEQSELSHIFEEHGYSVVQLEDRKSLTEDELRDKFEYSDIIHLDVEMNWDSVDPLLSRVDIAAVGYLETKELFALDLKSNLIILNSEFVSDFPNEINLIGFNRAALYAGTPTILYSLWPVDKPMRTKFYDYFYGYLVDFPPGIALSCAKEAMIAEGETFNDWGGYQLFGFQGMTQEEAEQYSLDQLENMVRMGYISLEEQDFEEAIHDYEQALKMAQTLNSDRYVRILREQLIEAAALGGHFQKAIDYQLQVLDEATWNKDIDGILGSYRNLAIFYTEQGNQVEALARQKAYIELLEEHDRTTLMGEAYLKLGLIMERLKQYTDALLSFDRAMAYYERTGDKHGMAESASQRGRMNLMYLDDYISALDFYSSALSLAESTDDEPNIVKTHHNMGLAFEKIGDYRSAYHHLMQAYELALDIDDSELIIVSRQFLANVSWKMGDYDAALDYQDRVLNDLEESGNHKYRIIGYATKGLIMMSLGQSEEALDAEKQALFLARRYSELNDEATIQKNIGLIYLANNEYGLARDAFKQSLIIDQSLESKRGIAYDQRDFGILYNNMNSPDSALYHLRLALSMSQQIGDRRNETHCYYEIGRAHNLLRNDKMAIDTLKIAEQLSTHLILNELQWRTMRELAFVYKRTGNSEQASYYFEQAIGIIEQMRSKIKLEQYQSGFIDDKVEVYGEYIEFLIADGDDGKAFEVLERSRSRSFLDLLGNKDISLGGSGMTGIYYEVKEIERHIKRIEAKLSHLRLQRDSHRTASDKESSLQDSLTFYNREYADRIEMLDQSAGELADLAHVRIVRASDIQSLLTDQTMLIEYFKIKDRLITWTITKDKVETYRIDLTAFPLEQFVADFRTGISQRVSVNELAKQLYDKIISPMRNDLNEIETLIIVPHSVLHYLPFAALMDENHMYLIDHFSIALSPSASVFEFCYKKGERYDRDDIGDFTILALGNPDLNSPVFDLPFAEKEIESIAFDYDNVLVYMNKFASENIIREQASSADMILFSCHGEFDPNDPLKSRLLLSEDEEHDGNLEAREIFGIDMNSYLIAMSACETGLSKIRGGDEVIGLNRSLIFAGGTSLLSSLWKVDDLATAVLIKRFFRNLKNTKINKAEALRQSQLIVRQEVNAHPSYWASFYLTGDFR